MRYTLSIQEGQEFNFLQKGETAESLQVTNGTLTRWMSQMGVTVIEPSRATFIISMNGRPILMAPFAASRKLWRAYVAPKPVATPAPVTDPGLTLGSTGPAAT